MILAIDPGNEESAYVYYDGERPVEWGKEPNKMIRDEVLVCPVGGGPMLVVEYTPPYAIKMESSHPFVPNEVALTALESGRFIQQWEAGGGTWDLLSRHEVKKHLLGRTTGTDAHIRDAVLDRYGGTRSAAVGKKASPGPLHGFKADGWQALAVAITYHETRATAQIGG